MTREVLYDAGRREAACERMSPEASASSYVVRCCSDAQGCPWAVVGDSFGQPAAHNEAVPRSGQGLRMGGIRLWGPMGVQVGVGVWKKERRVAWFRRDETGEPKTNKRNRWRRDVTTLTPDGSRSWSIAGYYVVEQPATGSCEKDSRWSKLLPKALNAFAPSLMSRQES